MSLPSEVDLLENYLLHDPVREHQRMVILEENLAQVFSSEELLLHEFTTLEGWLQASRRQDLTPLTQVHLSRDIARGRVCQETPWRMFQALEAVLENPSWCSEALMVALERFALTHDAPPAPPTFSLWEGVLTHPAFSPGVLTALVWACSVGAQNLLERPEVTFPLLESLAQRFPEAALMVTTGRFLTVMQALQPHQPLYTLGAFSRYVALLEEELSTESQEVFFSLARGWSGTPQERLEAAQALGVSPPGNAGLRP